MISIEVVRKITEEKRLANFVSLYKNEIDFINNQILVAANKGLSRTVEIHLQHKSKHAIVDYFNELGYSATETTISNVFYFSW